MSVQRVYFDNSASTPMDPRVITAMEPYVRECFANASSLHDFGRQGKAAMEQARSTLAECLGADPEEIVFTSGGTESNNLALKGVAFANADRGRHLIVSSIEHDCILNSCRWLGRRGFEITLLPVDSEGLVDPDDVKRAIRHETVLVSVMHANNEIGTVQPIDEIGAICRERDVYFHTDACQSFGRLPIDVRRQPLDLVTINAHKIYGPKGVGALVIRKGVRIEPWQHGGGHEGGLRSGTQNIPGAVGFAQAAQLCQEEYSLEIPRQIHLREQIIDHVLKTIPGAYVNGHRIRRLCNNVNLAIAGYEGEGIRLLLILDDLGFAVSSGSACSSNDVENKPSHVLTAIGRNPIEARGALRISLGRLNTQDEVDHFLRILPEAVRQLNSISSFGIGA